MRRIRTAVAGAAVICATAILPAVAGADCSLPSASGDGLSGGTTQTFSGHFDPDLNGEFIQIPFQVGSGITGMRIRYCYAKPSAATADDGPTLDLGVYGPKQAGEDNWTMADRRGWSGSAVKAIGIGQNGYTPESVYNADTDPDPEVVAHGNRKAYFPGYTTRAYSPGPIASGTWAAELGAGWIDPDGAGVDWKVEVVTSTDPAWSNQPFVADPYAPYVANSNPGWYTGDLHVHGEMEPGNAPMTQTFAKGFGPLASNGSGLDFETIVDHNNDNSRKILGAYVGNYPGKLIIPGVEVTTYHGHANAQYSSNFADFRMSDVYRWDDDGDNVEDGSELTHVRGPVDPSSQFEQVLAGGGWSQVNHPTIFNNAPAACRGCAWSYTDDQTNFSTVSAIEIQTGPAGLPSNSPGTMNPFSLSAIEYYEHALATGAHIAAVGSSDDHQGGDATGPTDSPVGRGATVVHAAQLSTQGVIDAVKAGHTYVKLFGADAPDVELSAQTPEGGSAIPGDSVTGSGLAVKIDVTGAASSVRPGNYTLDLLQDGIKVDSNPVTGDGFSHTFNVTETGRYSFELTRAQGDQTMVEAYSTPVWFTYEPPVVATKPSNAFAFAGFKANRKKGTATLKVKVASPGKIKLTGVGLKNTQAKAAEKNQIVALSLKPKAGLKKKLKKKGSVKIKVKVTNQPTGGDALSKSKKVKLLGKKAKKHRRR